MEIQSRMFNRAIEDLLEKKVFKNISKCAKALNTTTSNLSEIRNGIRGVSQSLLVNIMELGYTPNFLFGYEDEDEIPLNINYVPVDIHAGNSKTNLSEIVKSNQIERFRFPSFMKLEGELFAFRVRGESMYPTICDDDLVICRQCENPTQIVDGNVYVLLYDNEFVVKRLYKKIFDKKVIGIELISDNKISEYPKKSLEIHFFGGLIGNLFSVLKIISIKDLI